MMPRPPRLDFPNGFYHVFSRGNRKEKIFLCHNDYETFTSLLLQETARSQIHLFAWCLMPNHFHFLLETPLGNLSLFMGRLLTRYALYFNRSHNLIGHVFHGRYKSIVCDKSTYFFQLLRYIHRNPLGKDQDGLVERLEDWPWSSHHFYLGRATPDAVEKSVGELLAQFGSDKPTAIKCYLEHVLTDENGMDESSQKIQDSFRKCEVRTPRILGDESFIEGVKNQVHEPIRQTPRSLKRMGKVEDLAQETCRIFKIKDEELYGPSLDHRICRIRQALVFIGRSHYRFTTVSLASFLRKGESAISQIVRRLSIKPLSAEIENLIGGLENLDVKEKV